MKRIIVISVVMCALAVLIVGVVAHRKSDSSVFERGYRGLLSLDPDAHDIESYANVIDEPVVKIVESEKMNRYVQRVARGKDADAAAMACVMLLEAHAQINYSNELWKGITNRTIFLSKTDIGTLAERLLALNPTPESRRWLIAVTSDVAGPRLGP
jgi:hypothetical protein